MFHELKQIVDAAGGPSAAADYISRAAPCSRQLMNNWLQRGLPGGVTTLSPAVIQLCNLARKSGLGVTRGDLVRANAAYRKQLAMGGR